ncbi:MAG: AI-2E family transporter [Candidatus Bipolaricaulia bacterium]
MNNLTKNPIFLGFLFLFMFGGILFLFRQLFLVFFIIFAGILFAIFLSALTDFVQRVTRLPRTWSLALTVFILILLSLGGSWLIGSALGTQITRLINRLPEAWKIIENYLSEYGWGRELLSLLPAPQDLLPLGKGLLGNITGFFATAFGVVAGFVLVFFLGVYIAIEPEPYVNGFLALFPPEKRDRIREILNLISQALRWWLIGRAFAMAAVGIMTILALWLIGLPLAPTLGLMVGLLTFIPFIGPTIASIPAILVALVEGPYMVLWVVIIYVVIQQIENQIFTPLIQRRAVFLPPALLLSAQLIIGILFGFMGVLFASPLCVIMVILVQTLYIEDLLGESTKILGAHNHNTEEKG